jgi:hypothetical protein
VNIHPRNVCVRWGRTHINPTTLCAACQKTTDREAQRKVERAKRHERYAELKREGLTPIHRKGRGR